MPKILEKVERRLGEKLFLKGDRCIGPKCAAARRAYPPGNKGKKRPRGRGGSEYGELMREKQKMRFFYGLDDAEIKRYVGSAVRERGLFRDNFLRLIERRLDVIVWRLGLAPSRRSARQLIGHGHVTVNGRLVSAPSYAVRQGETIAVARRREPAYAAAEESDHPSATMGALPRWLARDAKKPEGTVVGMPEPDELGHSFDVVKIKEFYSR
ncbi:MAG: 30S ribosomal protein S4 [Patescibacteria group bacterium]